MGLRIIKKMRRQYAVYWEPTGEVDDFGKPFYEPAVEIRCRWEDKSELYINKVGKQVVSQSFVYVDRVLLLDGMLWKGRLEDAVSVNVPEDNPGAADIQSVNELPTLKADEFLRWVVL